jgi:hypothetical protein
MSDREPADDKSNPTQGEVPSSILTEQDKKSDIAITNARQPDSAHQGSNSPLGAWRISDVLKKAWNFAKKAESTNVAMAIATIVIAIATVLTWREVHNGSIQTDKIVTASQNIQLALNAANQQNRTALDSTLHQSKLALDASNKQAVLSQRAWLSVLVNTVTPASGMFAAGQPLDIRISQKNTGRTPALNLKGVTERTTVPVNKDGNTFNPPDFSYKGTPSVSAGNLPPDGVVFGDFQAPFTSDDFDRVINLKVRIYLHGRIEYDDVFGVHHWLTFCSFLLPGGAYAVCAYHNEIDQN